MARDRQRRPGGGLHVAASHPGGIDQGDRSRGRERLGQRGSSELGMTGHAGYHPIALAMAGRPCLVVGAVPSPRARWRACSLPSARVTVVSPALTERLASLVGTGPVAHRARDLSVRRSRRASQSRSWPWGTGGSSRRSPRDGRECRVWVNAADDPAFCDFILPSVLRRGAARHRGRLTGGASPALARAHPRGAGANTSTRRLRAAGRAGGAAVRARRDQRPPGAPTPEAWRRALAPDRPPRSSSMGRGEEAKARLRARSSALPNDPGCVSLVGAGPGDPGLMTVRGLDLLRRADVVIYDRLVEPARCWTRLARTRCSFSLARRRARTACRSRRSTRCSSRMPARGRRVVRLKGGDPFVFGRGGEEALALAAAGLAFEVVPGVSAAVAAPAYAGHPPDPPRPRPPRSP